MMPNPTAWPKCSECDTAFVLRRMMNLSVGGWTWLWQRDCKHKKAGVDVGGNDG